MDNTIKKYMVPVYAILVKNGRDIESLPDIYIVPVAEHLASLEEGQ